MILRLTLATDSRSAEFVVDTLDRAVVADLAEALGLERGPLCRVDDSGRSTLFEAELVLATSGICDGDVLTSTSGHPHEAPPARAGASFAWQLDVIAGIDIGESFTLSNGSSMIGRDPLLPIALTDPQVSRTHARISVTPDGVFVRDEDSANGTGIDGTPVVAERELTLGSDLSVGGTTMRLSRVAALLPAKLGVPANLDRTSTALQTDGRGGSYLNRIPSRRKPYQARTFTLPATPRAPDKRSFPWIAALSPLVFAGVIFLITKTTGFLLFVLFSPAMLVGTTYTNRKTDKRRAKAADAEYDAQLAATMAEVTAAIAHERATRLESFPTGQQAAAIAIERTERVWEREPGDADFLDLRIGVGTIVPMIDIGAPTGMDLPRLALADAPLTVRLEDAGVVGIAGTRVERVALMRSLVTQVASLHAADEVRIVLLAEGGAEEDWKFLRWLPHCWRPAEHKSEIALTSDAITEDVKELLDIVSERAASRSDAADANVPAYVVVLDDSAALRRRPDVAALLGLGPRHGVYGLALAGEPGLLPEERRVVVRIEASGIVTVEDFSQQTKTSGTLDSVDPDSALRAALSLAPLRRVGRRQPNAGLPNRLSLFEMLGGAPTAASIRETWTRTPGDRAAVPVGVTSSGTFRLDIVGSGPHALIGGTSGAGKSEFVQTWVASMALYNSPDDVTFLFVEYKGLSAFLRLQHLPHCVGTITNLSPDLTTRALKSLGAEQVRRQQAFADAGVSDISTYRQARTMRPDLPIMPRLVVVLDEFAEMKQQLPDFIDGLLSLARTGRSLGMHLILATQQVGRAVSPDIAGNANLRVALRAATAEDSFAVIGCNDANKLPQGIRGRAIAKRGELGVEAFQTAWSGGSADASDAAPVVAEPWPWKNDDIKYQTTMGSPESGDTELDSVISAIAGAVTIAGISLPKRPFTEPLPPLIRLTDLQMQAPMADLSALVRRGGPVIGRRDDLAAQLQEPYAIPALRGHVAILGGTKSGRTTTLRTTVAAWASVVPPTMLHVHGLDGARGLMPLTALPHAGTIVTAEDPRGIRLLTYLATRVTRRLEWLADRGVGEVLEWWAGAHQAEPVPWILLVIDRFEEIIKAVERSPAEAALERLLSHGPAAGVTLLAAGDETLARNKWQSRYPVRIVLRNTGVDSAQIGLPPRVPLQNLAPGRAYETERANQVQIGVVGQTGLTADQNEAIRALGVELTQRWTDFQGDALRLRDLPTVVRVTDLPAQSGEAALLGLGGDSATAVELTRDFFPLLIAGADGSGRSQSLRRVATSWVTAGHAVTVVGPPDSPLISNPPTGARAIEFAASASIDWAALLATSDLALVVDDLHRDDLPDELVAAMTPRAPQCLFAGATRPMTIVPEPLKLLVRKGSLLFLCPADPRYLAYYDVQVGASSCFAEPVGRGILSHRSTQTTVQVAIDS